jgi:hypothetical protein
MYEYAELIRAIAMLLWPLCALAFLLLLAVRANKIESAKTEPNAPHLFEPGHPSGMPAWPPAVPRPGTTFPTEAQLPEPKPPDLPPLE